MAPHTERRGRRLLYHLLAHDPPPDGNSVALAAALIDAAGDREGALGVATWLLGPRAMRDLGLTPRLPRPGVRRRAREAS